MQKDSFGYYLKNISNELVYKTSFSSCLEIDFRGAGKISFLKKVKEVRKYCRRRFRTYSGAFRIVGQKK